MQHTQDLTVAAAYASGIPHAQQRHASSAGRSQRNRPGATSNEVDSYEGAVGGLPSVDDLEVAAAAAAAAMEAVDMASSSAESNEEDDSSDSETSSSEYEASSEDDKEESSPSSISVIKSDLFVTASGEVKVVIRPLVVEQVNGVSLPASSDSDTSSESDTAEITDINEMREIISRMDDDDDGDHEKEEATALLPPVEPLNVEIDASESLIGAGQVSSILEGTIIVQEAENGRALSEGTVLCSEDRIPIGRIEDIFGPVMCPLYLLRWAGQGDTPASLVAGAHLFTTQKLAEFLLPEQLYTKGAAVEDDLEEEELEFSDDEKEAEYKRKQKAKRKQRDGLQEDLVGPSTRGMGRGAKGGARRSNMDAVAGPGRGWGGGRGRGSQHGSFNSIQANATAGQMAGMQLNSPGMPPMSGSQPSHRNTNYAAVPPPQPGAAAFHQGYAEGLRIAQQQLAQQHLQQIPFQQQSYQQYWHPQQHPAPGFMGGPPPPYNPSIMPASPAMGPPPDWQYGQPQYDQSQQIPPQSAAFFRGHGRSHRGGRC